MRKKVEHEAARIKAEEEEARRKAEKEAAWKKVAEVCRVSPSCIFLCHARPVYMCE